MAADPAAPSDPGVPATRVVRVLPDVPAIDREFDYLAPDALGPLGVGDLVRVPLHGRRVRGWVTAVDVAPPPGVRLLAVAKRTGLGPAPDLVDLAHWAAWRWAGRAATFLGTATAPRVVLAPEQVAAPGHPVGGPVDPLAATALASGRAVVRLPPTADPFGLVLAAAARGQALVIAPSLDTARHVGLRLRRTGIPVALFPRDWARAAGGATVVGARAAAWAPTPALAAVVVLDEHDEALQEEGSPTWHAREVAIERARRAGVPCVLVSPVPSLEALERAEPIVPSRSVERAGWPLLEVIDRRHEDPRKGGLWTERLVPWLRHDGPIVCVLNRRGRARLLACARCGELARCTECAAAVGQSDDRDLVCARCGTRRPMVCPECGGTQHKLLVLGVTRAREELEALLREPVVEVTGGSDDTVPDGRVYLGTEAVLHRVPSARVVVFLDIDQELLAPRYRAAEEALALMVLAARLVGPRADGGRIVVQTRVPHHEVLDAVLRADPRRAAAADDARRRALRYPPHAALAEVGGAAAPALVARLGGVAGLEVLGPDDGRWLLRAPDHRTLCDALAAAGRPPGRLRLAVDPPRV